MQDLTVFHDAHELFSDSQDCYAMGARATTALAIAVVPYGLESKTEATLHVMLAGALQVLSAAGCALVGGHTSEGAELALGGFPDQALCIRHPCNMSCAHFTGTVLIDVKRRVSAQIDQGGPSGHLLHKCFI